MIRDPSSRVLRRIVTYFYSGLNFIFFLLGMGDAYTRALRSRSVISGPHSRGGIEAGKDLRARFERRWRK
ncbi:MAG: hypothetical protein DMG56_13185 [Acidobacteria bacterium]|nr:MAG: hypothetical protein DMG54_22730 [Acidobacteriota bacterium]PYU61644.1 MAG: hypothetical protein DMG56_13185 [Acidobacteriota bacterium]PYU62187.1 MAG: hypothetical protein DMG55_05025 [Acidobacteriota bacterium]